MWLRVTMKNRPVMINGDHVQRIVEVPGAEADLQVQPDVNANP